MNKLSFLVLILILTHHQSSFAFIVFDPTNHVETAAIAANTAKQLLNQTTMIQHQLEMLKTMSSSDMQRSSGVLNQIDELTQSTLAISQSANQLNAQFADRYPNYSAGKLTKDPTKSSAETLARQQDALRSLSSSSQSITAQRDLLHTLREQNQGSSNSVQTMQVANNLALENIAQLQQLRQILAAQTQAQIAYQAQQTSTQAYQAASLEECASHFPSTFPEYHNDPRFGLIQETGSR